MNLDAEIEKALIGTWKYLDQRKGEQQEFTFKPNHIFTGRVGADGVHGYWAVKEGQFQMGPTEGEFEQLPIRLDGDEIILTPPNGTPQRWLRKV